MRDIAMRATDFRPHRLLRSPHVQSVLASSGVRRWLFRRRRQALEGAAVEHILDCGGGVRLQGFHSAQRVLPQPRGLLVLLHGWEGSVDSSYLLHTGARMLAEGWDVFRLNFRDHGDTHHLNPEMFHSCRIDEVVGAVSAVARRWPLRPLALSGFSLGGNFALRVALRAPTAGIALDRVIAVCPAIHPPSILDAIERAPWFYHDYFMLKWRGSLRRKRRLYPEQVHLSDAELRHDMRTLTRVMVERHTDFGSLDNYLNGYSIAGDILAGLRVPATILTAADDPIIPAKDLPRLHSTPSLRVTLTDYGGHCGFRESLFRSSWLDRFVCQHLSAD